MDLERGWLDAMLVPVEKGNTVSHIGLCGMSLYLQMLIVTFRFDVVTAWMKYTSCTYRTQSRHVSRTVM